MATTFALAQIIKTDRRVNGDLSFVKAIVLIDGDRVSANFNSRVGEEPIVLGDDTITVSDEKAAAVREAHAANRVQRATMAAAEDAAIVAARTKLEATIATRAIGDDLATEMRAHFEAHAAVAARGPGLDPAWDRYSTAMRAIVARHAAR